MRPPQLGSFGARFDKDHSCHSTFKDAAMSDLARTASSFTPHPPKRRKSLDHAGRDRSAREPRDGDSIHRAGREIQNTRTLNRDVTERKRLLGVLETRRDRWDWLTGKAYGMAAWLEGSLPRPALPRHRARIAAEQQPRHCARGR
jgi:hypothetical protein